MYAYAVNNPLAFVDSDGQDAIAVKYANLAHGLGHAGVGSVHKDGSVLMLTLAHNVVGKPTMRANITSSISRLRSSMVRTASRPKNL